VTIDAHEIVGHTWTIRQLFTGRRYRIDAYQREYSWSTKHIEDLVNDLTTRFREQWRPEHDRHDVLGYRPYFLGSLVTSRHDGVSYLVDGLQRVTSLTLLLIYLHRAQEGRTDVTGMLPLISSRRFDEESFNLQVTEGDQALWSLLHGAPAPPDLSPFDQTVLDRYRDIEDVFPDDLLDEQLPFLVDWLLHRVILVEVETTPQIALDIFESTSERGTRPTSLDLLRSFVLRGLADADVPAVEAVWRRRVAVLDEWAPGGAADFVKNWLRAKHAQDPADDDAIGTALHRWVSDQGRMLIGLHEPDDVRNLVLREFDGLGARQVELLRAAGTLTEGLEPVYYNAYNNVTLQYPLILAALHPEDDEDAFRTKARMIAGAMDIFVARCMIAGSDFRYPTIQRRMFALARELRGLEPDKLAPRLGEELLGTNDPFESFATFGLHQRNRAHIRYLLARMTAWLEQRYGLPHTFQTYASPGGYEVDHVLANRPELRPELPLRRFHELRDRFGGLLLLPRDVAAEYADMSYLRKLEHYKAENLLARSLHAACYDGNAALVALMEDYALPFAPVRLDFDEAAIERRQELYRRLFELVWDPAEYGIGPVPPSARPRRSRAYVDVTPLALIEAGLLRPGPLVGEHLGREYQAELTDRGRIRVAADHEYASVSRAATSVLHKRSWNGWTFWSTVVSDGSRVRLAELRRRYLTREAARAAED
jgi:Protein of unknown function DUF262/Restriction Enzyme Adenine Methylase Associated/Protein of unknown function (DUF1524)